PGEGRLAAVGAQRVEDHERVYAFVPHGHFAAAGDAPHLVECGRYPEIVLAHQVGARDRHLGGGVDGKRPEPASVSVRPKGVTDAVPFQLRESQALTVRLEVEK